ncbi:MAG TPA: hypothetical protein PLV92_23770, partial [Pirellulaceae bacterium]|nr:hypothetical protein [Pirellulaceae bacterium]
AKEAKDPTDASSSEAEELQRRQLRVVRRHEEMEQRFRELATALASDEPEQAERITKALALSKELLLRNRLEQAAEALRGVRWEPGATGHREIARDLQRLRAVLLSRDMGGADGPSAAEQLAARLAEILSRQQPLTVSTRELLKRRPAAGDWKRADRLQLGRVASEEKSLSSAAEAAAEAIADEPGGDVVASMVSEIQTALAQLSESVGKLTIDEGLVARQREVEQTLAELIRSLEPRGGPEAEPAAPSDAPKPDGEDGKPPLLAGAGQWKLLRSIQERIVQRTRAIEGLRRDGPLDAAAQAELKELARRQDELRKLVQRALGEVE